MKIGDRVKRTAPSFLNAIFGEEYLVYSVQGSDVVITSLLGEKLGGFYVKEGFHIVEQNSSNDQRTNYAAAFNMWMDEFLNNPQSFEDSYTAAMNHVSEKLLGEEPSYGVVAAEQFKQYLSKVTDTTGETK